MLILTFVFMLILIGYLDGLHLNCCMNEEQKKMVV